MSVIEQVSLHDICCHSISTDSVMHKSNIGITCMIVCGSGGVLRQLSTCANGWNQALSPPPPLWTWERASKLPSRTLVMDWYIDCCSLQQHGFHITCVVMWPRLSQRRGNCSQTGVHSANMIRKNWALCLVLSTNSTISLPTRYSTVLQGRGMRLSINYAWVLCSGPRQLQVTESLVEAWEEA